MRKLSFLLILVIGALCVTNAYAVAPTGCKSSGLLTANGHTHVTTHPSVIYAITVTPTANGGFAQILDTAGPRVSSGVGSAGAEYISKDKVVADPRSVTANGTIHLSYPEGVNVTGGMFVDRQNAEVEVYYKE